MYKAFYNLKENPFGLTPDPSYIYTTAQHREALAGLVYSCCTRPGLSVLVGDAGTGKSTLLYALRGLLEKRGFVTALLNNPTLTREEFYDLLIAKLSIDCASPLKSRRLIALEETLQARRSAGKPSVLIVDEAQRLSTELLEEIRLLLNVETPHEKLLQIIIAGQPELTQVLGRTDMRQFKQRISSTCRLEPLNAEDIPRYIRHRLTRAGLPAGTELFTQDTYPAIFEWTHGIPRLVNTLCDAALRTGFALSSRIITVEIVAEAATDMDLAPASVHRTIERTPVNGHAAAVAATAVQSHTSPPLVVRAAIEPESAEDEHAAIPFRGYAERQKPSGLLGNLIGRWRS